MKIRTIAEGCRGIISSEYIESETELLFIPKNLIIFTENCKDCVPENIANKFLSHHSIFAVFLILEQKNPLSFWEPYLSLLPTDFSNYPVFFSDEELTLLAGSSVLPVLFQQKEDLEHDFELVSQLNLINFKEFVEGRLLICSRLYSLKTRQDSSGLIPYADLFNHKLRCSTIWNYDFADEGFKVESQDFIDRNTEICIDYGYKSNIKLLIGYGFTIDENPDDEYIFRLKLSKNDFLHKKKLYFVKKKIDFKLKKNSNDSSFLEIFGFLRLKFCDSAKILDENLEKFRNLKNIGFLSLKNEKSVLAYLLQKCFKCLQAFPTTLQEDISKLSSKLSQNEKNCVNITKGEKEVLTWAINLCETGLKVMDLSYSSLSPQAYDPYIYSIIIPNMA